MSSTSPPPRRRFLPQPVETSTRSSKRPHLTSPERPVVESTDKTSAGVMAAATAKPRRFLPQPVEESARSSRKKNIDHVENVTTKNQSDPVDVGSKPTTRRFAPEPVETSARTTRRKFAPEPVEVSVRSSKDKTAENQEPSSSSRPRRKFAVEPVGTTTSSNRRRRTDDSSNESPEESASEYSSKVSSRKSSGSRKFAPELIETAKGEYRQGKKDGEASEPSHLKIPSPQKSFSESSGLPESRFSAAALAKRHHEENRRHSYCIPNLPSIESDSSGEDTARTSDLSRSSTEKDHHLPQVPEEERSSYVKYVLSLADRQALQEQVMAAYINEVDYQPVNHFAAEDEDDEDHHGIMSGKEGADPRTFRRSSQDELDLEMSNMRKHHEQLEQAKRGLEEDTAGASRFSAAALAARHHLHLGHPKTPPNEEKAKKKNKAGDNEFASMRAAASPPMLGNDIVFPYTISPKMTRCDVDQAPRPRRADSDDEDEATVTAGPKLWSATVGVQNNASAGLWMGMCQKNSDESRPTTPIMSGIQTPAVEAPNPFELWAPKGARTPGRRTQLQAFSERVHLAVSPPRNHVQQDDFTSSIDKKLELERQIDDEFPNRVITQIYNYLSLGYPSLARGFDEELSKISRISIEDLRRDDKVAKGNVKGYVGAPEGEGSWEVDDQDAVCGCKRWEALRLYVREWAKQSPNFTSEKAARPGNDRNVSGLQMKRGEAWGATVRKGSWAL